MAPRKATKHSDAEVVDRAAEAGDVSPPKRKKAVTKTASKSDEEKQIRLPRAAKSAKSEQTEFTDTTSIVTKNAKTKSKILPPSKNASIPTKTVPKVKSIARKNKQIEEKTNISAANTESVINVGEAETKRTRTKAATKKAGTDVDEDSKGKSKGRSKKGIGNENTDILEAPASKKKKLANTEVTPKESKSKAKTIKKKTDADVGPKSKVSIKKNKTTVSNRAKTDVNKTEELSTTAKAVKKINDDKFIKTAIRKTRGRKNEANVEDTSKDDEESKVTGELSSSERIYSSDNENQEFQNNQSEVTDLIETSKKGKIVKKKEEIASPKKVTKTRGKGGNRNVALKEDNDTIKMVKDVQKKTNKEHTSLTTATKKGRARKGATIVLKTENEDKVSGDSILEEKNVLNSSETLISNNNVQKSLEEDTDKDQGSEEEEVTSSVTMKKIDETHTVNSEVMENNLITTSIQEEEN